MYQSSSIYRSYKRKSPLVSKSSQRIKAQPSRATEDVTNRSIATDAEIKTVTGSPHIAGKIADTPYIIKLPSELDDKLKIIALGGLEEVGRNMMVVEYENDIVIIDMGFQFPEESTPGIDYIIPNISYFVGREKNIRGIIITHGHNDHMGAIPYLIDKLGRPVIYTSPLSAALIQHKHNEFFKDRRDKLNIITILKDETEIHLGKSFSFQAFHVNHNITDSFGVVLKTPVGALIHTGDFKFDFNPVHEGPADLQRIALWGSRNILLLMSDSTNADRPGSQISESKVGDELEKIISQATGRVIIGTFSSLLSRIQQIFAIAEKHGRKVLIQGRSLHNMVEIAMDLHYLELKPDTIIEEEAFKSLPDNKVIAVCTGAQGEPNAAFMRIATNDHKFIQIKKDDTIIFSSSVIPGNERSIQGIKDAFCKEGAKVVHNKMMDVHAGGHAQQEDLKLMMRLVKPKYFMPIHGNRFLLQEHADLAKSIGIPSENIVIPENGQVVTINQEGILKLTNSKIPTDYVMVDGSGVGDVSNIVLRDRLVMATEGMFVVIATINMKTGYLVSNPDIISRGFVYLKENKDLIEKTRMRVKRMFKDCDPKIPGFENYVKNRIRGEVSEWLFSQTKRRPMVLPVLIQV